jgi:hypothetical protein
MTTVTGMPGDPAAQFACVDLATLFNNDGISYVGNVLDGDLDGTGMTFPAQHLPSSNALAWLCDIPFLFPDKEDGALNNLALDGQRINTPGGCYCRVHLLGCSDAGDQQEEVVLEYSDSTTNCLLGLSSCRTAWGARYGELSAVAFQEMHFRPGDSHCMNVEQACSLWIQTIAVDPHRGLLSLVMPMNITMHLFALTLRRV